MTTRISLQVCISGVFLCNFVSTSSKKLTLKTGHSTAIKPSNFFGQIRWQTEANICLHLIEASVIKMMLLILNPSLIYSTDSVENTVFEDTNAVQTDTECGVRTRNAVCPPSVSLSSPLNPKMLDCIPENPVTWNTLEVGLQAKRKLRKI